MPTGLWLGIPTIAPARFAPNVAPRGAARAYTREVQRRADPAPLEQVGPRQYQLQAFPIPPRARLSHRRRPTPSGVPTEPPPILHLWLTYDTLSQRGSWPRRAARATCNVY